jgi:uncharacterized protein
MSAPSGIPYSAIAQSLLIDSNEEYEQSDVPDAANGRLSPAALLLISVVWAYRTFVPDRLKRKCIYTPTCSLYMVQAVRLFGATKGLRFGVARIKRCNAALYQPGPDPIERVAS